MVLLQLRVELPSNERQDTATTIGEGRESQGKDSDQTHRPADATRQKHSRTAVVAAAECGIEGHSKNSYGSRVDCCQCDIFDLLLLGRSDDGTITITSIPSKENERQSFNLSSRSLT